MDRKSPHRRLRPPPKRPLGYHVFWAVVVTAVLILAVILSTWRFGQAEDALPKNHVVLAPQPPLESVDSLNGDSAALPDLLGGTVAQDENPTETIDALGNPSSPNLAGDGNPAQVNMPRIAARNGTALIKAPIQGLSRTSPYGQIPSPSASGMTPAKAYARPYTAKAGAKPVSLIIGGLGINRTLTRRVINELPPEVTLAFAAHATGLQSQINAARAKGHEVLLELPMESSDFNIAEPGADRTLRITGTSVTATNLRNLDWMLSRAAGYFGVTNYNGSLFLSQKEALSPVMTKLASSGLGFMFDGSFQSPVLKNAAKAANLPYAQGFVLIDGNPDTASINAQLGALEAAATAGQSPIGVGFSFPQTISAVKVWTEGLQGRGLTLAPASHVMALK